MEEKNELKRNLTDEELDVFFRTNYPFQMYQDFTKKRKQSQKRKETKRNEGRVNKKRRVEDVEDVEKVEDDVEKFVNQFAKRLCIDDDV